MCHPASLLFSFGIAMMLLAAFLLGGMFIFILAQVLDEWLKDYRQSRAALRASREREQK